MGRYHKSYNWMQSNSNISKCTIAKLSYFWKTSKKLFVHVLNLYRNFNVIHKISQSQLKRLHYYYFSVLLTIFAFKHAIKVDERLFVRVKRFLIIIQLFGLQKWKYSEWFVFMSVSDVKTEMIHFVGKI